MQRLSHCFSAWLHLVLCRHAWYCKEELPTPRHAAQLYLREHLALLFGQVTYLLDLSSPSVPHTAVYHNQLVVSAPLNFLPSVRTLNGV